MQLAYQHPELCERLILVGGGGLGREVSILLRATTLPGAEYLLPMWCSPLLAAAGTELGRIAGRFGLRSPRLSEAWRSYRSLAGAENRRAFVRTVRSVVDPGGQTVSGLDRLYLAAHLPTLIVWGDRDDVIPVAHARHAHQLIDGSRLVILDGVGHFPHAEAPDRFVAVMRDFLEHTTPAEPDPGRLAALLAARH